MGAKRLDNRSPNFLGRMVVGLGSQPKPSGPPETRDGFVRQGYGYDAAMASLGLAPLSAGRTYGGVQPLGRWRRAERVALFESRDIHLGVQVAVRLFQETAQREEVTAEMVREVAGRLEAARWVQL